MIDSFVGGAVVAGWFLIICMVVLCLERRYNRQETLPQNNPRAGTPLATYQPQLVNPPYHRSHQHNFRVGPCTSPGMHQWKCRSAMSIRAQMSNDRNCVTPADEQSQFMNVSMPIHLSSTIPPSRLMTPMPRESPMGRCPNAPVLPPSIVTDKGTECTVCLGNLQGGEGVVRMPLCIHMFHEKCIHQWLSYQPNCPLCRSLVASFQNL